MQCLSYQIISQSLGQASLALVIALLFSQATTELKEYPYFAVLEVSKSVSRLDSLRIKQAYVKGPTYRNSMWLMGYFWANLRQLWSPHPSTSSSFTQNQLNGKLCWQHFAGSHLKISTGPVLLVPTPIHNKNRSHDFICKLEVTKKSHAPWSLKSFQTSYLDRKHQCHVYAPRWGKSFHIFFPCFKQKLAVSEFYLTVITTTAA